MSSNPSSKYRCISCVIDISRFVHESPGLKKDCFGEFKLFSMKYSDRLLHTKRLKIVPQMGRRDTYHFCRQETRLPFSIHR